MALNPSSPNSDNSMQALKQYGGNIVTIILLALAGYFGWTYWQNNHARVDTVAADQYADIQLLNEQVSLAAQNPDLEDDALAALSESREQISDDIDSLVSAHGDSVYAWQALMMKARMQVDNDDFTGAVASLKQALAIDLDDAGLKAITRLRYAQVLLANDELEAALSEAKSDVPISFEASQQELLGDIYQAQNDKEAAINAYNNAWNLISERNEERAVLALKMESLGIYPEPIKAQDSLIQQPAAPQGLTVDNTVMMDNDSDAINENNNSNEPE